MFVERLDRIGTDPEIVGAKTLCYYLVDVPLHSCSSLPSIEAAGYLEEVTVGPFRKIRDLLWCRKG